MAPEVYDLLISSSPDNTSLVGATVVAFNTRGFDAWSAVTEKRTKQAAERLQKAIDSTRGFLFVITPQTQFSSQMYFELGVAMAKVMSDRPARIIFVLVDSPWESIPRFVRDFELIQLESGSPQRMAERIVASLVGAEGSSAA